MVESNPMKYELQCDECEKTFDSNDAEAVCPHCGSEYTFVCKVRE